ncbi:hypothetical protein GHT06_014422 [Daphnia sinensis]|uniref:Uncharacterized protein n=1 Tax=Daphnia sinensis TaxID=1820382 RepID=A0AAD5LEF5_9CRUS|nr:hypothetical protein GHT06_014422 [Daphnia sinensis]
MDHWTISLIMVYTLATTAGVYSQQSMLMEADNAGHHHFDIEPSTDDMMACYYCINVSSNEICNRFAIETPCPVDDYATDLTMCYTYHVMDERGKTLIVTKQCATAETCSSQVGCLQDKSTNQTVCVSCCDLNYCNMEVAFNASDAVFLRSNDRTAAFSSASKFIGSRWILQSLTATVIFVIAFLSSLN